MKSPFFLLPIFLFAVSAQAQPDIKQQRPSRVLPRFDLGEQSPLEKAILDEDVPKVLELLKADPDLRNSIGIRHDGLRFGSLSSPLHFAIDHNKPKVARALLETGSDISNGYPLSWALSKKDESWRPLAKLLIEHGAQVNPPALHERGELPVVSLLNIPFQTREKWDFLLQHGTNPLMRASPDNSKSEILLERAFTKKNSDALAAILDFLPINTHLTVHHHRYIHRPRTPWDLAVINRNVTALKQLIARGADKEAHNIRGHTALYYAVEEQDEMMQTLLDAGVQPDEEILNYAIDRAFPLRRKAPTTARAAVRFLAPLVARVAPLPQSPGTYSPLLRAVLTGNSEVLQLLLESHPPADEREKFFIAVSQGNLEALRKSARKKPELISLALPDGETPLHLASLWAREGVIQFLLSNGAQVNALAKYGKTPLHYALEHPDIRRTRSTVACLFARGANPNALGVYYDASSEYYGRNDYREPTFSCAIRLADENLVRQFLDAGAYTDGPDGISDVPLNMVIEWMYRYKTPGFIHALDSNPMSRATGLALVQLLLERGANPNVIEPPIVDAVVGDEPDMALSKLLLRFGADINAKTLYDETILTRLGGHVSYFVKDGGIPKIRFALLQGADPSVISKNGDSILESVCGAFQSASSLESSSNTSSASERPSKADWLAVARLLLETKRVSLKAPSNVSLLSTAAWSHTPELVALLLEFGADPNEKNADGKTPMEIARQNGKTEMVALMEAALARKPVVH